MNLLSTSFHLFLTYDYFYLSIFVSFLLATHVLAFYFAGKITDSINDEITSAFTLLGIGLSIFALSMLVKSILSLFLSGFFFPALIAGIFVFVASLYLISIVYDLDIIKSIFFLILSSLITGAVVTAAFFSLKFLAPDTFSKLSAMTETSASQDEIIPYGKMSYEEYIKRGGNPVENDGTVTDVPVQEDATNSTDVSGMDDTSTQADLPATNTTDGTSTEPPTSDSTNPTTTDGTGTAEMPKTPGLPSETTESTPKPVQ